MLKKSLLLFLGATLIFMLSPIARSQTTILYLEPQEKYLQPTEIFTLTVYIADVVNLNRWQITIKFDPHSLQCLSVSVPSDNIFAGNEIINPPPTIDNEKGVVVKFVALDSMSSVAGSGKLVQIDFKAQKFKCYTSISFTGINQLNPINGTYLQDPQGQLITFQDFPSIMHILPSSQLFTLTKNGKIYNVTIYSNATLINDFIYNQTSRQIAFNLTAPTNATSFNGILLTKAMLSYPYIVVKTDTTVLPKTVFENQTHILLCFTMVHNTTTINVVVIDTGAGDLNGDSKVDIRDVSLVAYSFGSYPDHPRWNPQADITGPASQPDGKVDIRDVSLVASHFGEIYY